MEKEEFYELKKEIAKQDSKMLDNVLDLDSFITLDDNTIGGIKTISLVSCIKTRWLRVCINGKEPNCIDGLTDFSKVK